MKRLGLIAALGVFWIGCKSADDAPLEDSNPAAEGTQQESMQLQAVSAGYKSVQSILNQKCILCHGENGKEGIDLRTYESIMKGGEHGPIIKPGDAKGSLMVQVIQKDHPKRMPFKQDALPQEHVDLIEDWVNEGATKG
jgi:hypothetical protein